MTRQFAKRMGVKFWESTEASVPPGTVLCLAI